MKNKKGITLVSLVITVVVMMILAGTSVYVGMEGIQNNEKIAFINELKMVQAEVNIIAEKIKLGNTEYQTMGTSISELDATKQQDLMATCLQGKTEEQIAEFRYFTSVTLEQINIKNVKQEVVINFNTREVISVNGIEYEGIICYKLEDLPGEGYNV